MADESRFRYGEQFANIVNRSKPKTKWYKVDIKRILDARVGYQVTAYGSFLLMMLFGILAMRIPSLCLVTNPTGRCCTCVYDEPFDSDALMRMNGQVMPRISTYNDVYYGVVMVINSLFGMLYIFTGLRDENKYLLFAMFATQTLECGRGLLDTFLERSQENPAIRNTREIFMYCACGAMVGSWLFLRPLYKQFGWKIFRVGGAKKEIRQMYKTFQQYRALNLLDIQSSFMLFVIFFLYLSVENFDYWAFFCMFLCDIQASRYMLKYLKHEDFTGVLISVVSKLFVVSWWTVILNTYLSCFNRFNDSRAATQEWFTPTNTSFGYAPDLGSVADTYAGTSCISSHTQHDARTLEMLLLNFSQAAVFRIGSIIVGFVVCRNFRRGLRDVFYVRAPSESERELNTAVNAESESEKRYGEYSDEEYDANKTYDDD
jgi:hypothetical protein